MDNQSTKIGTIVSINTPQISCQLSAIGFDFVFIDMEHGNVSDETIASIILSKKNSCKVLIRISTINEASIKHALDLGCDGIIAPKVESLTDIDNLIKYCYYPPVGGRSVGFGSANTYGLKFSEYTTDFRPIILPQVESRKGLEIAEAIAKNDKLDGIFVGPYDLSMDLGIPGQFDTELFQKSYDTIRGICKECHKLFGTFTSNMQTAANEITKGTDMLAIGVDANLFLTMYVQMIKNIKNE